jgi:hypothetical protein
VKLAPVAAPVRPAPKAVSTKVTIKEAWNDAPGWYKASALGLATYGVSSAYPGTFLHELGHKAAIDTLFKEAGAQVSVTPFKGGATRWSGKHFTELGSSLGMENSRAIVSAAGPAVDLFSSLASFAVGFKVRKKHPNLGAAMMGYAGFRAASSVMYALTPCKGTSCNGHDFQNFAKFAGVPAWVSAVVIAAAIPVEYLVLKALEKNEPSA